MTSAADTAAIAAFAEPYAPDDAALIRAFIAETRLDEAAERRIDRLARRPDHGDSRFRRRHRRAGGFPARVRAVDPRGAGADGAGRGAAARARRGHPGPSDRGQDRQRRLGASMRAAAASRSSPPRSGRSASPAASSIPATRRSGWSPAWSAASASRRCSTATRQAMRVLGHHFVLGQTIGEALGRARAMEKQGFRHSYDMLGEGARTAADAERYFEAYAGAIAAIGKAAGKGALPDRPGISVKLSALHPRYEAVKRERVLKELAPRLLDLARAAKAHDLNLTVDAEEADRLELSLEVVAAVLADPSLRRLGRLRPGDPGLSEARRGRGRLGRRARHGARPAADGAPGQGRLLGHRDQARAGARACRLSGVHAQARHRPVLSRLRPAPAGAPPAHLSAIRHPQCADRRRHRGDGRRSVRLRVPAPARHGRGAVHGAAQGRSGDRAAASMRRSAAIANCSPIWCAGCWRTAPIPPSSPWSAIPTCRWRTCSSGRRCCSTAATTSATAACPCRATSTRRRGGTPRGWSSADAAELRRLARRHGQGGRCAGRGAPADRRRQGRGRGPAASSARSMERPVSAMSWSCRLNRSMRSWRRPRPASRHGRGCRRASAPPRSTGSPTSIEGERDALVALMAREGGKTLNDGIAEVREAADFCRYYASRGAAPLRARGRCPGRPAKATG